MKSAPAAARLPITGKIAGRFDTRENCALAADVSSMTCFAAAARKTGRARPKAGARSVFRFRISARNRSIAPESSGANPSKRTIWTGGDSNRSASATRDPAPDLSGSQTTAASTWPIDSIGSSTARNVVPDWPSGPVTAKPSCSARSRVGPTMSRRGGVSACSRISSGLTSRKTPIMVRIESRAPNFCTMVPPNLCSNRLFVDCLAIVRKSLAALPQAVRIPGSSVEQDRPQVRARLYALHRFWHDHQGVGRGERAQNPSALLSGDPRYPLARLGRLKSDTDVVPALTAIVDAIRGYDFYAPRLGHSMPEHRQDRRSAEDDEADGRRHRVTRKP